MSLTSISTNQLPSSPCIGVCTISKKTKMCVGCLRTLQEIGAWRTMTIDQKRLVTENCKERSMNIVRPDNSDADLGQDTVISRDN